MYKGVETSPTGPQGEGVERARFFRRKIVEEEEVNAAQFPPLEIRCRCKQGRMKRLELKEREEEFLCKALRSVWHQQVCWKGTIFGMRSTPDSRNPESKEEL